MKNKVDEKTIISLVIWVNFTLFSFLVWGERQKDPIPTPQSVDFYGQAYINGKPVKKGDIVTAYDSDDEVLCGKFVVKKEGHFGFMPVYADDPTTAKEDEGAKPGDIITFKINGNLAQVKVKEINEKPFNEKSGDIIFPKWTKDGDRIKVILNK